MMIWPVSAILAKKYDVPYNRDYMVHSRSDQQRPCLPICSPGGLKPFGQRGQTRSTEHKFASYMVRRTFSLKKHREAGCKNVTGTRQITRTPIYLNYLLYCSHLHVLHIRHIRRLNHEFPVYKYLFKTSMELEGRTCALWHISFR
jgi:hypothetical protein